MLVRHTQLIRFVAFYFSFSQSFVYKSYQDKVECESSSPIVYPKSLDEVVDLVLNAKETGGKLKVVGSRHSITDTICTSGTPIHLHHFNKVLVDRKESVASVGTGLELKEAMDRLHELGYTVNHIPAYGGITVGGAIALGAHGSSLRHSNSLSDYLVGVTLVDGNGKVQEIGLEDESFDGLRVNFGLLGAVVEVKLKVEPRFKMRLLNFRVEDSLLVESPEKVLDMAKRYDWFQFWWFPSQGGLVLSQGTYYPAQTRVVGDAKTNLISNISPIFQLGTRLALELIQATNNSKAMDLIQTLSESSLYKVDLSVLLKQPIFVEQSTNKFVNPAIGYNYRLMSNKCTDCPWDTPIINQIEKVPLVNRLVLDTLDQLPVDKLLHPLAILPDEVSIALDLRYFEQVVTDINSLITQYPTAFPLIGLFFRFSKPSQGLLSLAKGRATFHIDWTFPQRLDPYHTTPYGLTTMQVLVQLLVFKYKGRPHWGKNGLAFFQRHILKGVYPDQSFKRFKEAARRFDPNGTFSNKFGDRILGVEEDEFDINVKVDRCALQDYCICTKDQDCSRNTRCSKVWGYSVCA